MKYCDDFDDCYSNIYHSFYLISKIKDYFNIASKNQLLHSWQNCSQFWKFLHSQLGNARNSFV